MIAIKLGGSVITNKSKPLCVKKATIKKIACSLRKIKEPIIVVHGGGSFGHYWSIKYRMHSKPAIYNMRGVATVKNSMIALNKIIVDEFLKQGLKPYSIPPAALVTSQRADAHAMRTTAKIAKDLMPITYGDALWISPGKTFILSGDRIMSMIATVLRPKLCIFALDEEGVYDLATRKVIPELKAGAKPIVNNVKMDVTGGIARKLAESARIAKVGTDVFIVNGNFPDRIVDAIKRKHYQGTIIRGMKHGRRTARTS